MKLTLLLILVMTLTLAGCGQYESKFTHPEPGTKMVKVPGVERAGFKILTGRQTNFVSRFKEAQLECYIDFYRAEHQVNEEEVPSRFEIPATVKQACDNYAGLEAIKAQHRFDADHGGVPDYLVHPKAGKQI